MKSNSFEKSPYSTFILGRNIRLEDSKELRLIDEANLDDIILSVKWNDSDYIMPMTLKANFYNSDNSYESIEFVAINNNIKEPIKLWSFSTIDRYKTFAVKYIKFEYRSLHSGENISLDITAYIFEDEKEKRIYAEREATIRNEG